MLLVHRGREPPRGDMVAERIGGLPGYRSRRHRAVKVAFAIHGIPPVLIGRTITCVLV